MTDHRTSLHTTGATWRAGMVYVRLRSCSSTSVKNVNGTMAVTLAKPGARAHFPGIAATTRRRTPL